MNKINRIFQEFGENSKIIIMVRHGFKTANGRNITPECLDSIIKNGVPGLTPEINMIQHGSYYLRTDETVCAITLNLLRNGGQIINHFPKDDRLANPKLFGLFTDELDKETKGAGLSTHEGLRTFRRDEYNNWTRGIDDFIFGTFSKMNPRDVCLVPAHTPVVEMSYNLYSKNPDPAMIVKELEYIFIVQPESGGREALKQNHLKI